MVVNYEFNSQIKNINLHALQENADDIFFLLNRQQTSGKVSKTKNRQDVLISPQPPEISLIFMKFIKTPVNLLIYSPYSIIMIIVCRKGEEAFSRLTKQPSKKPEYGFLQLYH